jgi:hypothetical protein
VTYALALALVVAEAAAGVDMVVMRRQRRLKSLLQISISKGRMRSSTNLLLRLARTLKMPTRKRRTLQMMQKRKRRRTTHRARSLILCRHLHWVFNPPEEVVEDEEAEGLGGVTGGKRKENGTSLLSGSRAASA